MKRDWFAEAFGAAVDDIRKRLVEEPWFGREVSPPTQAHSMAQTLGWEKKEAPAPEPKQEPDLERDR